MNHMIPSTPKDKCNCIVKIRSHGLERSKFGIYRKTQSPCRLFIFGDKSFDLEFGNEPIIKLDFKIKLTVAQSFALANI